MHHYMQFDPYLIREHNHQIFREVQALRFEKRLRKNQKVRGSRLAAFILRLESALHPIHGSRLPGR